MPSTIAPAASLRPLVDAELGPAQLARLTGRSERTARRWLSGETSPRGKARAHVDEIATVLEELGRALPGAEAGPWLERRNPELDFRSPAELIAADRTREVLALLAAIGEGAYL